MLSGHWLGTTVLMQRKVKRKIYLQESDHPRQHSGVQLSPKAISVVLLLPFILLSSSFLSHIFDQNTVIIRKLALPGIKIVFFV